MEKKLSKRTVLSNRYLLFLKDLYNATKNDGGFKSLSFFIKKHSISKNLTFKILSDLSFVTILFNKNIKGTGTKNYVWTDKHPTLNMAHDVINAIKKYTDKSKNKDKNPLDSIKYAVESENTNINKLIEDSNPFKAKKNEVVVEFAEFLENERKNIEKELHNNPNALVFGALEFHNPFSLENNTPTKNEDLKNDLFPLLSKAKSGKIVDLSKERTIAELTKQIMDLEYSKNNIQEAYKKLLFEIGTDGWLIAKMNSSPALVEKSNIFSVQQKDHSHNIEKLTKDIKDAHVLYELLSLQNDEQNNMFMTILKSKWIIKLSQFFTGGRFLNKITRKTILKLTNSTR